MSIQEFVYLYTLGKIKENAKIKKFLKEVEQWKNKLTK